jgi:TonB family protein
MRGASGALVSGMLMLSVCAASTDATPGLQPAAQSPNVPGKSEIPANASSGAVARRRLKVGGAVKPPVKLVDVRPVYPDAAREAHIQGVVILTVVIGDDGRVIDTQVTRSIPELDQAAIDAVSQWVFQPTVLNGEPVEIEMVVTINFTA